MITVLKFGGTSMSRIEKVYDRILEHINKDRKLVIVVSAFGDQTRLLMSKCNDLTINNYVNTREIDAIVSTAENVSAASLALYLSSRQIPAISLDARQAGLHATNRELDDLNTHKIKKILDDDNVVIVTGFQGYDNHGDIVTLDRGGSDITAVFIASKLELSECYIYTDVDGVYTTDPNKHIKSIILPTISYDNMIELSKGGAKVIHSEAVNIAKQYSIKIRLLSTFISSFDTCEYIGSAGTGTIVCDDYQTMSRICISSKNCILVSISIDNRPGSALYVFESLNKYDIKIDNIIQSKVRNNKGEITFTVDNTNYNKVKDILSTYHNNSIITEPVTIITIVGCDIYPIDDIYSQVFKLLSQNDINLECITTTDLSVSCIVSQSSGLKAISILHDTLAVG